MKRPTLPPALRPPRFVPPLPSRAFPRELLAHRHEVPALLRPSALVHAGRLADGERLIGLLMVRDENDILEEHLRLAVRFFDRILVLDGTAPGPAREECHAILARFPEVVFVATDESVGRPVRDGARRLLLEEARRRYGTGNWIGILHADELHLRDPRPVLASLDPLFVTNLRVRLLHFFLHPSDEQAAGPSVMDRVRWCMWPGVPEARFFYDRGIREYEWERHSKVTPASMRAGRLLDGYLLPQFNFRTADQARARAVQRTGDGWQGAHYTPFAEGAEPVTPRLELFAHPRSGGAADPVLGPIRAVCVDEVPPGPRRAETLVPVFIGGTGRCGSTLVKELLAEAPGAWALPVEAKAFSWPAGFMDLAAVPTRRGLRRLAHDLLDFTPLTAPEEEGTLLRNWGWRLLAGRPAFPGYEPAVELLLRCLGSSRLTPSQRRRAVRDFVATVWEATVPGATRVWLEQTPANTDVAAALLDTFPAAHVVYVRRHPLDIAAGLIARPWGPNTALGAAQHILASDRAWRAQLALLAGSEARAKCHVVRFEDVLASPAQGLAEVFAATGLPSPSSGAVPPPARRPRVADDLHAEDRRVLEELLGPLAAAWGYGG